MVHVVREDVGDENTGQSDKKRDSFKFLERIITNVKTCNGDIQTESIWGKQQKKNHHM
jgi:hypothetical protein